MKIEQKIGVVGNGFVGGAVKFGFSPTVGCDVRLEFMIRIQTNQHAHIRETVNESDFIFLSVPTSK